MHQTDSIVLSDLTFSHDPLEAPTLTGLEANIPHGRTGIVGRNGSGKTTLLRLVTGELTPTRGAITVPGSVGALPQDLLQRRDRTVSDLVGIGHVRAALREVERGSLDPNHYDAIGTDWDIESRAEALLSKRVPSLHGPDVLDRGTETLSGGETVLTALAGLELAGHPVTVLDEPTNNLDATARSLLHQAVSQWRGILLVVSHDVELLNLMDNIVELHDGSLTVHGGNYDSFTEQLATTQAAAERSVRAAEQKLRSEQAERDHVQTVLARRQQKSRKDYANKRAPRMVMKMWAEKSQKSRAGEAIRASEKVAEAKQLLDDARESVRDDHSIRVKPIDPGTATGRRLAELHGTNRTVHITGGHRLGLVGDNGVGKTTLLRALLDVDATNHLHATATLHTARHGFLDQRLALDENDSALEELRRSAPSRSEQDVRAGLARFLLRGDIVERPVGTLSGGERFRVAFAKLLLADPPPELLVLDEPTNNLDLDSIDQLVTGLRAYRGALLVVTHDAHLLEQLELDEVVELTSAGELL